MVLREKSAITNPSATTESWTAPWIYQCTLQLGADISEPWSGPKMQTWTNLSQISESDYLTKRGNVRLIKDMHFGPFADEGHFISSQITSEMGSN